ncbi:MAG: hypothetical protein ACYC0P_03770 [Thiobacillus sp.]
MQDLGEALRLVEAAGYTVTDDRVLTAYYAKRADRLSRLLARAKSGDWLAAEEMLKLMMAPGHIPYSGPLSEFTELIAMLLLSRKPLTSARNGKRVPNPLLAALLGTDSRKDYALLKRKLEFRRRFDAHWENGTQEQFDLSQGQSKRRALIEYLAKSENIPSDRLDQWLRSCGKNME